MQYSAEPFDILKNDPNTPQCICFSIVIMAVWLIAGIATTIFIALFDTEDFKRRLNMKQPPDLTYKLTVIGGMVANLAFCYVWEVSTFRNSFSIKN